MNNKALIGLIAAAAFVLTSPAHAERDIARAIAAEEAITAAMTARPLPPSTAAAPAATAAAADNTPCPPDGKHAYGLTCAQVQAQDAANAYLKSPAGLAAQAQAADPVQHCITAEENFVQAYGREPSAAQWPASMWMQKRYFQVVGSLSGVIAKKNMEVSMGGVPVDCDATYAELLDYVLHGSNE